MITIILVNVDVNQCASMYCVYDMYESIGFCIDVFMNSNRMDSNRPKSWYDDSSFNDDDMVNGFR